MLSLILSYHYKILAGFCLFLLFVNIIKAYTPRSLARNKIFKTIFYISLSLASALLQIRPFICFGLWIDFFALLKSPLLESVSTKIRANIFFIFSHFCKKIFSELFFVCLYPVYSVRLSKYHKYKSKEVLLKNQTTSQRDLLGTILAYTGWFIFHVCVFLNLLTYSLTSTYAHSKQKPRKVWVKSPSSPASSKNSVTIESVFR